MAAPPPRLHALTWTVWMLAAALCTQAAPGPIPITTILVITLVIVEVHGQRSALASAFPIMVLLGVTFGLIRVLISVLTTHANLHVLFTMPALTVPRWLGGFTVGGTIERNVLLQSLTEAYTVVGLIAAFAAWNAVVSHHEVLRAVPRVFHEPALVVTIAIAFVPSTLSTLRTVMLADRARCGGEPVRRGRLRRLILPVFEGGLERAIALAESMDSRGLGHSPPSKHENIAGWLTLAGLLGFVASIIALVSQANVASGIAAAVGIAAILAAIVVASQGSQRTRYRPRSLTRIDWLVMALTAIAAVGVALASARNYDGLTWSPEPSLAWPAVNYTVIGLLALLLAPLLVMVPAAAPVGSKGSTWAR